MAMTNSFQFLKEDISESLASEIKRLKNSHQLLKDNIKAWTGSVKKEMLLSVTEIVESVKLRCEGRRTND